MKKILIISGWVVMIAGASVLLGFAKTKRNNTECKSVDITVPQNDGGMFLTASEINDMIARTQGEVKGKTMNKINLLEIEQMLKDNPFVLSAKVYATLDGDIKISVTQKNPVARIEANGEESFYVDSAGYFMPLTDNCTPRVMIVNGNINETYTANYKNNARLMEKDTSIHSVLPSIFKLVSFISKDPFWKAQVTQIYVDSAKEFILIPRVGGQKILIGDTSNIRQKFDRLFVLYKDGFNSNGKWNEYATINLKYKHQIICTKK